MNLATHDRSMAYKSRFPGGATWQRVDFHLHTKEDKEFSYKDDVNFYYSNYVDALERAGIGLGVITNHNKFDFTEFKSLRSTARKRNIELLPGVELSVNDGANGIHTLIVFSEAWLANGQDCINPFLTVAFEGKTPAQYEQKNGRSSLSLIDTIKKLEGYERDFFIVFAHVENKSGLWVELDGGRIEELGKSDYFRRRTLGFQKVRTHDGAGSGKPCRTKVQSWLGNGYPAEVEGSDPKTISKMGEGKACYLKLGEQTFEAVKFALNAHKERVASEPPKRTASCIRSARFEGGVLDGKVLRFSPELNTLIGIRGSGKSSILEAIRYALDIPLPQGIQAADTEYKEALVKHTLGSGGKVTIEATDRFGQDFTISRIFRETPNVYLDSKVQPGVTIRETVLTRPIYFGQKDLAARGEGFEADMVEKFAGEKLQAIRTQIEDQRQKVRDAVERFRRLQTSSQQKEEYKKQLADTNFQLKKFSEYGVEDKLQQRLCFQKDRSAIDRMLAHVAAFRESLDRLLAEHEDDLRNELAYQSAENSQFFESLHAEYKKVIAELDLIQHSSQKLLSLEQTLQQKCTDFSELAKGLQEEFAEVERKLAEELKQNGATAIQPDDFLQLQQRKTKAEQMIEALSKQEDQQTTSRDALINELDTLNELWLEEYNTIKSELDRVNVHHHALRIEPEFKGNKEEAIRFMKSLYQGSNIREATLRGVMENYADFGALFRDLSKAKTKAGSSPDHFEDIFLKNLADLTTYQVPNAFRILYHGKELRHHSLGQRASALILFVLSQQENDVIIIDQPEDDLDNQTIYDDVIKLLCRMKPHTQFLFATHNPNLPVLGDAEQVHACRYQDDSISVNSGGVDAKEIQNEIINIMEGGHEAFEKRADIYHLWNYRTSSK